MDQVSASTLSQLNSERPVKGAQFPHNQSALEDELFKTETVEFTFGLPCKIKKQFKGDKWLTTTESKQGIKKMQLFVICLLVINHSKNCKVSCDFRFRLVFNLNVGDKLNKFTNFKSIIACILVDFQKSPSSLVPLAKRSTCSKSSILVDFLKVLCFSFPVLIVGLSLAFPPKTKNIKNV